MSDTTTKRPGPLQEADGSWSIRRILAALAFLAAVALGILALPYAAAGWYVFIPSLAFIVAALLLLFFTTWESLAAIAAAWKGKRNEA